MTRLPLTVAHEHTPLYRVVRRQWSDPIDASYSQRDSADNRWNTPDFPALYCCCSETVARAVARDVFRLAAVDIDDLQDAFLPQLCEIIWRGEVVDVASAEGVLAAGLPSEYPIGSDKSETRSLAAVWHAGGFSGIVARSASLMRLG
ncbi:MAG TPA: RES family NAD+ phosphorylase, partial [Bryobacteraceae bacterium]|nr:RES family NAD+ phosphorylase [Bryobacteraceae bacterium]